MKSPKCTGRFAGFMLVLLTILAAGAAQATDDPCRVEARNANDAAQRYRATAREVAQTCTQAGGDCLLEITFEGLALAA
jgi:hypothetical protein